MVEYVVETTHGDHGFTTDAHHADHHRGIEGWWDDHKSFINGLVGIGATIVGIYYVHRGQKIQILQLKK